MKDYIVLSICLLLLSGFVFSTSIQRLNANDIFTVAIKSQINDIGNPKVIDNISLYKYDVISSRTIADRSKALSSEQVCVSLGAHKGDNNLQAIGQGKGIQAYDNYKIKATVVCDRANNLQSTVSAFDTQFNGVNLANDCSFDLTQTSRVCLIAINGVSQGSANSGGLVQNIWLSFIFWILAFLSILANALLSIASVVLVKGSKRIFYLSKIVLWVLALAISFVLIQALPLLLIFVILLQPVLSFFALKGIKSETDGKNAALICKALFFLDLALILFSILLVITTAII